MDQQVQRIQRIRVAKIANKIASTGQVLGSAPVTLRTCHKIVRQPAISVGALQIQRIRGGEGALQIRVAKTINKIASTGQVVVSAPVILPTCHKIVRQPAICVDELQGGVVSREMVP